MPESSRVHLHPPVMAQNPVKGMSLIFSSESDGPAAAEFQVLLFKCRKRSFALRTWAGFQISGLCTTTLSYSVPLEFSCGGKEPEEIVHVWPGILGIPTLLWYTVLFAIRYHI